MDLLRLEPGGVRGPSYPAREELCMARGKKHTAEQIVNLLRQVEVWCGEWQDVAAGVQGNGNRRADVLPMAQGVWRAEGGPGAAAQGA